MAATTIMGAELEMVEDQGWAGALYRHRHTGLFYMSCLCGSHALYEAATQVSEAELRAWQQSGSDWMVTACGYTCARRDVRIIWPAGAGGSSEIQGKRT